MKAIHLSADGFLLPRPLDTSRRSEHPTPEVPDSCINGAILWDLLRSESPLDADASFLFFRNFAREIAFRLAKLDPSAQVSDALPEHAFFHDFPLAAPPFPGSQFLSEEFLRSLAHQMLDAAKHLDSTFEHTPSDFVRAINPAWSQLGKVFFHLAENRADSSGLKPFVFLATVLHRISETNEPKHLPLGAALKFYRDQKQVLISLLQPIRDASAHSPFLRKLTDSNEIYQPCLWTPADAWHFLQDIPIFDEAGIVTRMTALWQSGKPPKLQLAVSMNLQKKQGFFSPDSLVNFSLAGALNGIHLSSDELNAIRSAPPGLIRIKGTWTLADPARVAAILDRWNEARSLSNLSSLSFLQSLRYVARAPVDAPFLPQFADDLCEVHIDHDLNDAFQSFTFSSEPLPLETLPAGIRNTVRPYQIDGVRFLHHMHAAGFGACLADDMGLGKTLQVIAFLELLRLKKMDASTPPALIVMPASLLNNWLAEFQKFAPPHKFKILHATTLSEDEKIALRDDPGSFLDAFDSIAVTYHFLAQNDFLRDIPFSCVILDEAQYIKNPLSRQSRAARQLRARTRIALTGTPIENNLGDLWSLFDFIQPGLLGNVAHFRDWLRTMETSDNGKSNYSPLRNLIAPFILRRMKSDRAILRDLPDKIERECFCSMTIPQAKFYQSAVNELKIKLASLDDNARAGLVLSSLTQLKQICDHPSLYTGNSLFDPARSGKFQQLAALAKRIADRGEKLLVFSQFREMLSPLHELLCVPFGRNGLLLHGGTPVPLRAEYVSLFQKPDGPPFFLLSLRAAGTGLNLTAANHVVHFDRWWNPAVENQATDRAYRIGQHKNVQVHKLITRGTLEEKINAMLRSKQALSHTMLPSNSAKLLIDMSKEELLNFLQFDVSARIENDDNDDETPISPDGISP